MTNTTLSRNGFEPLPFWRPLSYDETTNNTPSTHPERAGFVREKNWNQTRYHCANGPRWGFWIDRGFILVCTISWGRGWGPCGCFGVLNGKGG